MSQVAQGGRQLEAVQRHKVLLGVFMPGETDLVKHIIMVKYRKDVGSFWNVGSTMGVDRSAPSGRACVQSDPTL